MSSKTRKLIWSVPLMATLAVVGALAVFVALGLPNAGPAQAQDAIPAPTLDAGGLTLGNKSIGVDWDYGVADLIAFNISNFRVEWRESTATTWDDAPSEDVSQSSGLTTSYTITGLTNETDYNVRVVAVSGDRESDPSVVRSAIPAPTNPGKPQNVMVSARDGSDKITVTWDAPANDGGADITSYVVTYTFNGSGVTGDQNPESLTGTARKVTITHTAGPLAVGNVIVATVIARSSVSGVDAPETGEHTVAAPSTKAGIDVDSTSSSAAVQVILELENLGATDAAKLVSGGSIELFLEDDYVVPDSIPMDEVFFRVPGGGLTEGNGGRVFVTDRIEVNDGDFFGGDDDWAIQFFLPDLCTLDNDDCDPFNGPDAGSTLQLVISSDAGIKNPSEQEMHSLGYKVLGPSDASDEDGEISLGTKPTLAKISLSADDGGRGKEITIAGSGFNDGTEAEAKVLVAAAGLNDDDDMTNDITCAMVMEHGDSLGTANVGSDDKFSIAFTVHNDEFDAGEVNYICAEDSEAGAPRPASAVKLFKLTASISLDPAQANSGDEVTLKARDFGGALTQISLGPDKTWTSDASVTNDFEIKTIEGDDYTFEVPGGLSGVVQVAAKRDTTRKTADLTVTPSSLTLSETEVAPNQSIIISGSGFSEDSYVLVEKITIDGKPLVVDESGVEKVTTSEAEDANMPGDDGEKAVKTTSAGAFTASVNVWSDDKETNPALDDGTYKVKVTDVLGFSGTTTITVLEPTLTVFPTAVGPRDYITISGANWPVSTTDDDREVRINVDDRNRNTRIDSTGRFNYEYQLRADIGIGQEHTITVTYEPEDDTDPGDIKEEITFLVVSSNVTITPAAAAPGETIDLEMTGMPIHILVDNVIIAGADRLGNANFNTDADGSVTVTGVLVPYADPGFYPVRIEVGEETAVVQLEILAEADVRGAASPLPEAVMDLGDSVVRIFHFNTDSKEWTFYDPRPEFEGLNTLTELAAGQPYWILVSENVENVVLNGKTRNLTCVGGDCWNQLVW